MLKVDFGYLSEQVFALAAKGIIASFYGQAPAYSYYDGCSDGGREALMEAQRFPRDFKGPRLHQEQELDRPVIGHAGDMRLPGEGPARGRTLTAAFLCVLAAALAACSGAGPATVSGAATSGATADQPAATATATATAPFSIEGTDPVLANGSQDTHAASPGAECDNARFTADESIGTEVAGGFKVAGFPVAASLLTHFLAGTGTEVDYPAGSPISREALASSAFLAVNNEVQAEIARQLQGGRTRVQLSAGQLPTVLFGSKSSDLYWGFRGTQGLTVTGHGRRENGRYAGTLTYVIRDSYGFPADDTLDGFGPPMRYLQTVCGAPQHVGGARWFPDAITVRVPLNRPGI